MRGADGPSVRFRPKADIRLPSLDHLVGEPITRLAKTNLLVNQT
jgi:hypothetical protein